MREGKKGKKTTGGTLIWLVRSMYLYKYYIPIDCNSHCTSNSTVVFFQICDQLMLPQVTACCDYLKTLATGSQDESVRLCLQTLGHLHVLIPHFLCRERSCACLNSVAKCYPVLTTEHLLSPLLKIIAGQTSLCHATPSMHSLLMLHNQYAIDLLASCDPHPHTHTHAHTTDPSQLEPTVPRIIQILTSLSSHPDLLTLTLPALVNFLSAILSSLTPHWELAQCTTTSLLSLLGDQLGSDVCRGLVEGEEGVLVKLVCLCVRASTLSEGFGHVISSVGELISRYSMVASDG